MMNRSLPQKKAVPHAVRGKGGSCAPGLHQSGHYIPLVSSDFLNQPNGMRFSDIFCHLGIKPMQQLGITIVPLHSKHIFIKPKPYLIFQLFLLFGSVKFR